MRGVLPAAAVLVLAGGCTGGGGAGVAGGCTGPQLSVAPAEARVGEEVTISVEWLHEGCDDTGRGLEEERPATASAVLVQDGAVTTLGALTGRGERFSDQLDVTLPAGAVPGPASVALETGDGSSRGGSADLVVLR
ncbi:hypothetical protein [Modestobacter sp. SYSU DS0290]